jgi:trk system potassium uptake protein
VPTGPGLQWSNLRTYVHLLSPIPRNVLSVPHIALLSRVFVLIVGAGRVGSAVAKSALAAGHEVSVLDEDPLSHERLDAGQSKSWEDSGGQFTVGTALETDALIQAGIERADAFIASTAGDNTNLVIAQLAQKRFGVEKAIVRVMDPARADWYGEQGLQTISPTKHAIDMFQRALEPETA